MMDIENMDPMAQHAAIRSTPFNMAIWKHPHAKQERTDSIDLDPLTARQCHKRTRMSSIPFEPLTTRQSFGGQRSPLYYMLHNFVVNVASYLCMVYKYATYLVASNINFMLGDKATMGTLRLDEAERGQCTNIDRQAHDIVTESHNITRESSPRNTPAEMYQLPPSSLRSSRGRLNSDSLLSKVLTNSQRRATALVAPIESVLEEESQAPVGDEVSVCEPNLTI